MNLTNIDTALAYPIATKPKSNLKKIVLKETFYIRKNDLAVIGYEAIVTNQYLKYFPERKISMKYKGLKRKCYQ
jgi:hypothetical protein